MPELRISSKVDLVKVNHANRFRPSPHANLGSEIRYQVFQLLGDRTAIRAILFPDLQILRWPFVINLTHLVLDVIGVINEFRLPLPPVSQYIYARTSSRECILLGFACLDCFAEAVELSRSIWISVITALKSLRFSPKANISSDHQFPSSSAMYNVSPF
jgi:hypothetical protein